MFYFIHIPKTAGTSFVQGLQLSLPKGGLLRLYGKSLSSPDVADKVRQLSAAEREAIQVIAGHQVWYGIHELFDDSDPQYLTFVRRPLDRIISDYHKIRRTPTNEFHAEVVSNRLTLAEFVHRRVSPYIVNHMTVFLGRDSVDRNHNGEQCVVMDQRLLNKALSRLNEFSFVGLQETFGDDLKNLSGLMGVAIPELHENRPAEPIDEVLGELTDELQTELCELNRMDAAIYELATNLHERRNSGRS